METIFCIQGDNAANNYLTGDGGIDIIGTKTDKKTG